MLWICVEKLMDLWDPDKALRCYQGAVPLSCYGSCLKSCQCMFSFPLNYGTSKILYIEACFLIIFILHESFFARKFVWNMSVCFKAFVDTRTQPESMITLLLFHRIIKYHSLSFTLKVQSHVSGVHTFKRGGWEATEPLPHSTGWAQQGREERDILIFPGILCLVSTIPAWLP